MRGAAARSARRSPTTTHCIIIIFILIIHKEQDAPSRVTQPQTDFHFSSTHAAGTPGGIFTLGPSHTVPETLAAVMVCYEIPRVMSTEGWRLGGLPTTFSM